MVEGLKEPGMIRWEGGKPLYITILGREDKSKEISMFRFSPKNESLAKKLGLKPYELVEIHDGNLKRPDEAEYVSYLYCGPMNMASEDTPIIHLARRPLKND